MNKRLMGQLARCLEFFKNNYFAGIQKLNRKKERGILMYNNIISEIRLIVKQNGGKDDKKNDDIISI